MSPRLGLSFDLLAARSALLPTGGASLSAALALPHADIALAFGGHALAPRARITDMMVPEFVTLRARFVELRAASTYAARFRAGAIAIGAGISVLRMALHASSSELLQLRGGRTHTWTFAPYALATGQVHLSERWSVGAQVRAGFVGRPIEVAPPDESTDFSHLHVQGWLVGASLSLEATWG